MYESGNNNNKPQNKNQKSEFEARIYQVERMEDNTNGRYRKRPDPKMKEACTRENSKNKNGKMYDRKWPRNDAVRNSIVATIGADQI